jgi:hypothetical protein
VLGDGLAILADEGGEPAEGDPLSRIDPDRAGGDPFRCGEVRLGGQPGAEPGLVEEQLTASAAAAAASRKRPGWLREAVAVTPVLPHVVGAAALAWSPDAQGGQAGRSLAPSHVRRQVQSRRLGVWRHGRLSIERIEAFSIRPHPRQPLAGVFSGFGVLYVRYPFCQGRDVTRLAGVPSSSGRAVCRGQ